MITLFEVYLMNNKSITTLLHFGLVTLVDILAPGSNDWNFADGILNVFYQKKIVWHFILITLRCILV